MQDSDSSGTDIIFLQELGMWRALQSHDTMAFQSLLLPAAHLHYKMETSNYSRFEP